MLTGLVLMVGEYWFAVWVDAKHIIPASHRVLEWVIIIYGAYLASPPVGR
jgi:hypothetical protein